MLRTGSGPTSQRRILGWNGRGTAPLARAETPLTRGETKFAGGEAYGTTACRSLATSNPDRAVNNADSHEYFAETR
jgi:hypothetical protein